MTSGEAGPHVLVNSNCGSWLSEKNTARGAKICTYGLNSNIIKHKYLTRYSFMIMLLIDHMYSLLPAS